jgi:hypothetical protein
VSPKVQKIISSTGVGIALVLFLVSQFAAERLKDHQTLGCIIFGVFAFSMSVVFFVQGAIPFRVLNSTDCAARFSFRFACASLAFSALQVPAWWLMTRRFPPDGFTRAQAIVATAGVVLSLFGPAAPLIYCFIRFAKLSKNQRRKELLPEEPDSDKQDM